MNNRYYIQLIALTVILVSVVYLLCTSSTSNPYSSSNVTCDILLKNSAGQFGDVIIEDSVDNSIYIGIKSYLPQNIDSVKMTVTSFTLSVISDTVLLPANSGKTNDTLWKKITFLSAGEYSVKIRAYTSISKILTDSATIIIHEETIRTIDSIAPVIKLKTPVKDSALVTSASTTISVIATDQSGIDSVTCSFGDLKVAVSTKDSVYSATVDGLAANQLNRIRFIAVDASGKANKDTLFVLIKYVPPVNDIKKPTLTRKTPAQDTAVISSSSTAISVIAKDESGIASVACSFGDSAPAVSAADSVYTATVKGLAFGQFNKIRFIATDSSSSANKDTLLFFVKYDSTIADNAPPILTVVSGPAAGTMVTTSPTAYELTITDKSGIDSVYWMLNGTRQAYLAPGSGGKYALSAGLTSPPHSNRITVHAWDKSANHNRDSVVIAINYDQKPKTVSRTDLTTPRATALPCTLTATDPEGDPLSSWTVLSGWPKHGTVTNTIPVFTYTPTSTYEGEDTIFFIVSDGMLKSDTGTLVISIASNNIAPVIKTQPVSVSVDQGKTANFTAAINTDVYPQPGYVRWVHNNTDTIAGQTTLTCTISAAQYKDSGTYKVVVRNAANTAESDNAAKLTVKDKTSPTVQLSGDADITIMVNGTWNDPGATATDDKDGPLTVTTTSVPQYFPNKLGKFVFTYSATDAAGNAAKVTRTLHVEGWTSIGTISASDLSGIVVANDSILCIGYIVTGSPFGIGTVATYKNGTFQPIGATITQTGTLSMALSYDKKNVYFTTYDLDDPANTLRRINGTTDWTSISDGTQAMSGYRVELFTGPTNIFVDANCVDFGFRSGIKKLSGSSWDSVSVNDGQVCESSTGGSTKKMSCVTDNGTIYSLACKGDYPICNKFSNGNWSPAAGADSVIAQEGIASEIANRQILAKDNDVYAGFTLSNGQSDPTIWRLRNGAWTKLRSMAQSATNSGNGFSMTFASDGTLYAARSEGTSGNSITVRSYNESTTQWDNVPTIGPATAFQTACDQLCVAAGRNVCYVAIQSGTDIVIWQWKRQL